MLERASTCLESGGRQLFRGSKPCLRSRRTLHSHFWHHGASDLSLPIWWAASSIFDASPSGDVDDREATKPPSAPPRHHDSTLLDFLYPEKTLALLKRLSVYGSDAIEPRRRQLYGAGVRQYSTTAGIPQHDDAGVDPAVAHQAKKEMESLLEDSSALAELQTLLSTHKPGKQELAWQLYSAIPETSAVSRRIQKDLMEYLVQDGADGGPAMPGRALQIFRLIPASTRRPLTYRAAILAYITFRMVGPAIQLLEEVGSRKTMDIFDVGPDLILRRTVFDEQWDLSLRVLNTCLWRNPKRNALLKKIRCGYPLPELWKEAKELPELLLHFQSFFDHVREFQHELRSTDSRDETLKCLVMTLVPHVMDRVLTDPKLDMDSTWDYFIALFQNLHALNLPTGPCYEYAIKQMLALPLSEGYTNKRKLWLELYRRYRQHYLNTTKLSSERPLHEFTRPSKDLIFELIKRHSNVGGRERVLALVQDLRDFYPGDPLQATVLFHLIHTFSDLGDHVQVHEYIQELQTSHKQKTSLKTLYALIFVYARRADVEQTHVQFKRISEEFHLAPDLTCWNILLLAYTRADDLDGALECFNNCINSGMVPDKYTFGPMLDFCAHRGDVEAFETLFSRAKSMGIALDSDVRARSGYVECFLNAGDAEGANAIAQGMFKGWRAGILRDHSLTHTWNMLIQHYARNRDLATSRQLYKQMVENGIPLDTWTYGSLMRALVEVKQTNAAYRILRVTMPENNFRVHAFHYAIVMAGFLREEQYELASEAHQRMEHRKVRQTDTSRETSLQTLGTAGLARLKKRRAKHPNWRMLEVEEALQDMLVASTREEGTLREPRHTRSIDARNQGAAPQGYYASLISLYTNRFAFAICKKLIKKADEATPTTADYAVPVSLSAAIMEAHFKAGEHDKVASTWKVARETAGKLTKTFPLVVEPFSAVSESDSLLDPSVQELYEQSQISHNRRQILVRACRIYIRSLLAQPEPEVFVEVKHTIRDLLVNGFTIDNFTWNEYIRELALRGNISEAFQLCEQYLMPRFPGWRNLYPGYIRHDREGYQHMEIRHYDIKKSSVLPRYKTLVVLAKVYGQVKNEEQIGIGYDKKTGQWLRETLEEEASMTIRAIESMPRTGDKLQERLVSSML